MSAHLPSPSSAEDAAFDAGETPHYWSDAELDILAEGVREGLRNTAIASRLKKAGFERSLNAVRQRAASIRQPRSYWTDEEISFLKKHYRPHDTTRSSEEIAAKIGRSASAVRSMAARMQMPTTARRRWDEDERARLRHLVEVDRLSYREAALMLNRTERAVSNQAHSLGISNRSEMPKPTAGTVNRGARMAPADVETLREMAAAKKTRQEIGEVLKKTAGYVGTIAKAYGIEIVDARRANRNIDDAEIRRLRVDERMTSPKIAAHFQALGYDCPTSHITHRLEAMGLNGRLKLDDETVALIAEELKAGTPDNEIVGTFNVSLNRLGEIRRKAKIDRRRTAPVCDEQKDQIRAMALQEHSDDHIAKIVGLSKTRVSRLRRQLVPPAPRTYATRPRRAAPKETKPSIDRQTLDSMVHEYLSNGGEVRKVQLSPENQAVTVLRQRGDSVTGNEADGWIVSGRRIKTLKALVDHANRWGAGIDLDQAANEA